MATKRSDGSTFFLTSIVSIWASSVSVSFVAATSRTIFKTILDGNKWVAEFHGERSERRRNSAVEQQKFVDPNEQHCYRQNQFAARWHVLFPLPGKNGKPNLGICGRSQFELSARPQPRQRGRCRLIDGTNKNNEAQPILLGRTKADGLGELTDSNASIDRSNFPFVCR